MIVRFVLRIGSKLNRGVYRLSKGRLMGRAGKLPLLLLTTTGAKTGKSRTQPLSYVDDGGRFVVIASYGGQPRNPAWYHNLVANPRARVQIRSEIVEVTASVLEGFERDRLWEEAKAGHPGYEGYATRTKRTIPIVALTPTPS